MVEYLGSFTDFFETVESYYSTTLKFSELFKTQSFINVCKDRLLKIKSCCPILACALLG